MRTSPSSRFFLQRIQKSDVLHRKPHSAQQQRCGGRGASGFLKVIEILDTISSPRCHKTRALLVTITEHKAIDLYREKRRNVLPLAEEYIGAAPAAEIERLAERDTLAAAIASLPPRYRSVLLLRYDCGYSNAEIAEILDTTEAERAQAHPACQGKTQRTAERDGGTINEDH